MENTELKDVIVDETELNEVEESRFSTEDALRVGGGLVVGGFALKGLWDTGKSVINKIKAKKAAAAEANGEEQPKKKFEIKLPNFKKKNQVETTENSEEEKTK